jgi:hyperosmotically inducible protein
MKTNPKTIACVLAAISGLALAGCDKSETDSAPPPAAPNNSPGQYVDDTALTAKVKAALAGDSAVKSSDISVTTNSAVVTLSGQVPNSDQKAVAVKDAASVAGVKDVTNNLTTP